MKFIQSENNKVKVIKANDLGGIIIATFII